jgi:hypothetical protein
VSKNTSTSRERSKSRGAFVEVPYFLSKYDPDPLRFYLTATAPETRDTEACPEGLEGPALPVPSTAEGSAAEGFSWEDFVEQNNPMSTNEGPN